ncbi:helix-turn-helix domain-containing protein [Patulibacter brassicae]|uniref:Helix-turn-helix domain-containing protein n=1 Tax=Patulibacter brassicae TaxID=1705717 RepID=A0ABU4VH34_9ACTN|nr:helix-turn-helix domain-containing protein [Patulibacter brassicae]MDX8151116.1 helix-turn-helix domain-containing protein [Patulibacter brassicae]
MSVQAISYVLDHSEARGSDRLVLIALANHAGAEHAECWPSVPLIASEARVSERTAQYALRALEKHGRIERKGTGPQGQTRWRVVLDAAADTAPPADDEPAAGADPAPQEEPADGAEAAPGADSAGAQDATEGVQTTAPGGADVCTRTVKNRQENRQTAATDASATAPARDADERPKLTEPQPDDPDDLEQLVTAAASSLATLWLSAEIENWIGEIRHQVRLHLDAARATDWTAVPTFLTEQREKGRLKARKPPAAVRYVLRQDQPIQQRPATPAPTNGARRRHAAPATRVVLPHPTEPASAAWAQLRDVLPDMAPEWEILVDLTSPVDVQGTTLQVTAEPVNAPWIRDRLVSMLDRAARKHDLGTVAWVDPPLAARSAA